MMSSYRKYDIIGKTQNNEYLIFENKIYHIRKSDGPIMNRYLINLWRDNPKNYDIYFCRFGHSNCSLGSNKFITALKEMDIEELYKEVVYYKGVRLLTPAKISFRELI